MRPSLARSLPLPSDLEDNAVFVHCFVPLLPSNFEDNSVFVRLFVPRTGPPKSGLRLDFGLSAEFILLISFNPVLGAAPSDVRLTTAGSVSTDRAAASRLTVREESRAAAAWVASPPQRFRNEVLDWPAGVVPASRAHALTRFADRAARRDLS